MKFQVIFKVGLSGRMIYDYKAILKNVDVIRNENCDFFFYSILALKLYFRYKIASYS